MEKQRKSNRKLLISILIFIALMGLTTFYFINSFTKKQEPSIIIQKKNKNKEEQKENSETENIPSNEIYVNNLPSYRAQYNNNNIVANLKIPSLEIDTLITRTNDNKYYLNHDIYNNYTELGNTFIDFRNQDLNNNKQINIYGHNTQNEKYFDTLPFTKLDNYKNKEFFDQNKKVLLAIDEKEITYQVIAVKIITNEDNEHMYLSYNNDNDWYTHINNLLSNTLYNDNSTINSNDQILVLQACNYNPKNSYILVICKKVS